MALKRKFRLEAREGLVRIDLESKTPWEAVQWLSRHSFNQLLEELSEGRSSRSGPKSRIQTTSRREKS